MILIPRGHFISRQVIGYGANNLELRHNNPIISYLTNFPGQILDQEELERNSDINNLSAFSRQEIVTELKKIGISLVVPIEFKEKLVGVYLLGGKMSEDPFNKEDLKLLQHVAWEMSFAIDNARSYEELKHLDEAKANFIQVVSHQMRTPVTIARCNLELALDKELNPSEKEGVLRAAYEGISSLSHQLDQLLTVLEIEEKEMAIRKEMVNLNELVDSFMEENKLSLKNKKLKVDIKPLDSAAATIECDKNRIRRVLDILLLNAINYTPSGGKVAVTMTSGGFNGKNNIIVSVADNGVGINDADKVNLFKKFFRSPEAISMFPNGFGLGLFIARKIVRAHGGDIWFDGREGQGMTFSFSLPLKSPTDDKKYI
jgi:signal transduction histidine kinase